jgi:hypothetical protein
MKKSGLPIILQIHHCAPFPQNIARKLIKKRFLDHASRIEQQQQKIVAHPTDHGNAHFGPTQQPTNNTAALV